ncbi:LANO_0H05116g1_1 [Lachancea nothofagi CBS 11611]|uniref:Ribosomal lysine N-methyltransferase 5 n=1 Tax=Lachancea nothofagi CBS 11611 TaxID=1266666 RepID=A0A1G4KLH5_9SACH|nr:LANO_0H05116g1_1 [Lachancea nothofagi CBS 11611]
MDVKLKLLNEDTIYEHLFERYSFLQKHAESLKQDLGIVSRSDASLELNFEPPDKKTCHRAETFSFELSQSLSALNSSQDNSNSTTGYVVWTTTPFFLQWLLYSEAGRIFTIGGSIDCEDEPSSSTCEIPAMFSSSSIEIEDQQFHQVIELGCGVCGILGIALGNYVDKYVYTDQKALLNRLKNNIAHNIDELRLRNVTSTTLGFDSRRKTPLQIQIDVLSLDWETFNANPTKIDSLLKPNRTANVSIVSMDVVYNEYLIEPYLKTLSSLLEYYERMGHVPNALLGIQLRDQDVVERFLECAIIDYHLKVYVIMDPVIEVTRFGLYYIKLQ